MATALVYEMTFVSQDANGAPTMRMLVSLMDQAAPQGAPRGQVIIVDVTLDPASPAQFVQQTRNAIIAVAGALQPPVTLNPADVIQGMFA